MRNLAERDVVRLDESERQGDPVVSFPAEGRGEVKAFELLRSVMAEVPEGESVPLSGLKDDLRKKDPTFSEKKFGYSGFLQFVKAANAKGVVDLSFDDESGIYSVSLGS